MQQKFCSSHYPFAFHNKTLAKKLSDFDKILTSKLTQMVFWVVKFLSKSDKFLAKFLNFLKGPSIEYLISLFFELTHMYVKQKSRRLSGPLTWGLGPISGELCICNENVQALQVLRVCRLLKNGQQLTCARGSCYRKACIYFTTLAMEEVLRSLSLDIKGTFIYWRCPKRVWVHFSRLYKRRRDQKCFSSKLL